MLGRPNEPFGEHLIEEQRTHAALGNTAAALDLLAMRLLKGGGGDGGGGGGGAAAAMANAVSGGGGGLPRVGSATSMAARTICAN